MIGNNALVRALITLAVTASMLTAFASNAAGVVVRGAHGQFLAVTLRSGTTPTGLQPPLATASEQQNPSALAEVSYNGGPVVHSSDPFLVYWAPSGETIPAASQSLLERYLTDAAADSDKADDVFDVDRQYYDHAGFANYRQTFDPARQVVLDPQPYPARDARQCPTLVAGYLRCVTDDQVQTELQRLITANGLPTAGSPSKLSANAPVYVVILPADVDICIDGGLECADNDLCAYHGDFEPKHAGTVLYAAIPVQARGSYEGVSWPKICQYDGTAAAQEPNGDNADVLVGLLSHEYSETLTDPISPTGWYSHDTGNEIGDNCQMAGPFAPISRSNPNAYLPVLGGSASAGTLYDQLINGHPYYTQSEWSNGDRTCELKPSPGTIAPRITVPGRTDARTPLTFSPGRSTSANPYSSATWTFGDGSRTSFFRGHRALNPVTHTYPARGRYTITLTLVDNRGNVQTASRAVSVSPPVCVVPNVRGESLRRSISAIHAAHCVPGSVETQDGREHKRWPLVVRREIPRAGSVRSAGTRVTLTLVHERVRR